MSDSPLHCLACGYDVSGTPARCPECGVEISASDRDAMVRRGELMIRHARVRVICCSVVGEAAAVCVMMAAAFAATKNSPLVAGLYTVVALSVTVGGTLFTGAIIPRLDQTHNGEVARAAWERLLPVLHFSWMSIPVFTLLLMLLAWGMHSATKPRVFLDEGVLIALPLFAIWGTLAIMAVVIWSRRFKAFCDACGYQTNTPPANSIVVLALLFFALNAAIGFAGGVFATLMVGDLGESLGWFATMPAINPKW